MIYPNPTDAIIVEVFQYVIYPIRNILILAANKNILIQSHIVDFDRLADEAERIIEKAHEQRRFDEIHNDNLDRHEIDYAITVIITIAPFLILRYRFAIFVLVSIQSISWPTNRN